MGSIDVVALDAASGHLWDRDFRVLNTHHFAPTDRGQVAYLMDFYKPHGEVLDVGCGFGEVARLMADMGAPAKFTLLNISEYQLSKCPEFMTKICANAEHMPEVASGSFDCVMANSSLMNMDREAALTEAHRVLKPDGHLLLSDVVIPVAARETYDAAAMRREMHVEVTSAFRLIKDLYRAGFRVTNFRLPVGDTHHMADLGEVIERLFTPLKPIVLRCIAVPKDPPDPISLSALGRWHRSRP